MSNAQWAWLTLPRLSCVLVAPAGGRADTRNLMPRRCTAERTAISGLVSRLRLPCIDLWVAGDEAYDSFAESAPTHRTVTAEHRWRRRQPSAVPAGRRTVRKIPTRRPDSSPTRR